MDIIECVVKNDFRESLQNKLLTVNLIVLVKNQKIQNKTRPFS